MTANHAQISKSANQQISESAIADVTRHSSLVTRLAPWAAFAALLVWGWRGQNLFHDIPTYGDVLELMWGISWYGDALRTGVDPAVYPLAFYPGGWQLATFGQSVGPALFLAMLPLHWIAGAAFAYQDRRPADLRAGLRGHACARRPVHGTVGRDSRGVAVHILGLSLVPDPRPPELPARFGLSAVDGVGVGAFLRRSSTPPRSDRISRRGEVGVRGDGAFRSLSGSSSSGLRGPRPSPARCTSSGSAASCWPAGCSGGGWENRSTGERL